MKKLRKGQKVLVLREARDHEKGWDNSWEPEMDASVGKVFSVREDNRMKGVRIVDEEYLLSYPHFVLANPKTKKQLFPDDYYKQLKKES